MTMRTLHAANIIDKQIEGHYHVIAAWESASGRHNHDFYEIFLVTEGSAWHCVNEDRQCLQKGSLVLIRPADAHEYQRDGQQPLSFINLAFTPEAAQRCFDYLAGCIPVEAILAARLPPHILLEDRELAALVSRLQTWNTIPLQAKSAKKAELRALLVELLARYLASWAAEDAAHAPWITRLLSEMHRREHLVGGLPAMIRLSGKSHEHLCRVLRKRVGLTPTALVNKLRLEYAGNLLINSNWPVLQIAGEAGFENLSHFNHLFKMQYGCSPRSFRQNNRSSALL